jgi:methyl-accepting chemotaxis protein
MKLTIKARIFSGFSLLLLMLAISTGVSSVLIGRINTQSDVYGAAQAHAALAKDIDLTMTKVRVRVNQWLRSLNPAFAKQADELLAEDVALVAKAASNARSDEERKIVEQMDTALKAYIASWGVVQSIYADEAKIHAEKLDKPGAEIAGALATIRNGALAASEIGAATAAAEARDDFTSAAIAASRYRTTLDKAALTAAETGVANAMSKIEAAVSQLKDAALMDAARKLPPLLTAWRESFALAAKTADTRVARLDSWTRNEGEAMAVASAALMKLTEKNSGAVQTELLSTIRSSDLTLYVSAGIIFAVGVLVSLLLARSITGPLGRLTHVMTSLARGDRAVTVPHVDRDDEIGQMAKSTDTFRQNLIETDRLREQQEAAKAQTERERREQMLHMAQEFEAAIGGIVRTVSAAATEMEAAAQGLSGTAETASRQATAVAAASEEASSNVQTVATAGEELSSSIAEIGRQVSQSTRIAGQAVEQATRTDVQVQGLVDAAQKIGEVVKLINDIAAQTNLLALNATIEAARAGEAGKGFAVVASEVKNLANQTAKATEEIGQQIAGIQGATKDSVEAIKLIGKTIGEVNEIATAIASAVEEQSAATQEIARNVQQAAKGTQDVSTNITGVTQAANQTGTAATQVLGSAKDLSKQAELLRVQVDTFLSRVRAA